MTDHVVMRWSLSNLVMKPSQRELEVSFNGEIITSLASKRAQNWLIFLVKTRVIWDCLLILIFNL